MIQEKCQRERHTAWYCNYGCQSAQMCLLHVDCSLYSSYCTIPLSPIEKPLSPPPLFTGKSSYFQQQQLLLLYYYYSFHFLFLLKQFSCFATNKINFFSSSSSSSYSHRIKSLTSIMSKDAVTKPKQVWPKTSSPTLLLPTTSSVVGNASLIANQSLLQLQTSSPELWVTVSLMLAKYEATEILLPWVVGTASLVLNKVCSN